LLRSKFKKECSVNPQILDLILPHFIKFLVEQLDACDPPHISNKILDEKSLAIFVT